MNQIISYFTMIVLGFILLTISVASGESVPMFSGGLDLSRTDGTEKVTNTAKRIVNEAQSDPNDVDVSEIDGTEQVVALHMDDKMPEERTTKDNAGDEDEPVDSDVFIPMGRFAWIMILAVIVGVVLGTFATVAGVFTIRYFQSDASEQ